MIRVILGLVVVVCLAAVARADGHSNAPPRKLGIKAQQLFEQADANGNGTLDAKERSQGDLLAETAIEALMKDHTIGARKPLPTIPEPILANPKAMTSSEFTLHFEALAARKDANFRTSLKIKNLHPIGQEETQPGTPAGIGNQRFGFYFPVMKERPWMVGGPGYSPANQPSNQQGGAAQPPQKSNAPVGMNPGGGRNPGHDAKPDKDRSMRDSPSHKEESRKGESHKEDPKHGGRHEK